MEFFIGGISLAGIFIGGIYRSRLLDMVLMAHDRMNDTGEQICPYEHILYEFLLRANRSEGAEGFLA